MNRLVRLASPSAAVSALRLQPGRWRSVWLLAALLVPAFPLLAAEAPRREISDAVGPKLGELRQLTEDRQYAAALDLIDRLLTAAEPDSYDRVVLDQIKAQVLLAGSRFPESISALEDALAAGRRGRFFEDAPPLETYKLLAQLYYQEGAGAKATAVQSADFDKALAYIRDWLKLSPKPTADASLLAASLLYAKATANPAGPDKALLAEVLVETDRGLRLAVKPPDSLRLLQLAAAQQLGDRERSTDLLELIVAANPSNTSAWQQLLSNYLNLAAEAKGEEVARLQLRAVLALERAQAHGQLTGPHEQNTLVTLYLNLRQYSIAARLLEEGLAAGKLEDVRRGWDLLVYTYQQQGDDRRTVDALQRAIRADPTDGQLDYQLAQFLYGQGRTAEAYASVQNAPGKTRLEHPGQVHLYLAYLAYELNRYDDALRWLGAAAAFQDAPKDELERLSRAVTVARRERGLTPTL